MRPYSKDYLEQYNEIDIALDTFPYNGGLTTCEALYMGVPVISLRGNYHGSKIGASILTAAGLSELIAQDSDEYIKKAVELANGNFADYQKNLREKISKSDLMDGKKYAAEMEKLFEKILQV
jgi:predicted O-linked N-acetylglucosamine transferase (SPINDLY family)